MKRERKILKLSSILVSIFLLLTFTFVRSFMGIFIFGYRLGELVIGGSLLLSFVFLLYYLFFDKENIINKQIYYCHLLIIISFFVSLFIGGGELNSSYTYKASSYIWTISIFYVGLTVYQYKNNYLDKF